MVIVIGRDFPGTLFVLISGSWDNDVFLTSLLRLANNAANPTMSVEYRPSKVPTPSTFLWISNIDYLHSIVHLWIHALHRYKMADCG